MPNLNDVGMEDIFREARKVMRSYAAQGVKMSTKGRKGIRFRVQEREIKFRVLFCACRICSVSG